MAKFIPLRPRKFALEFRPSPQASVPGGQLAVAALLEQFGLAQRVAAEPAPDPRTHPGKGYTPLVYGTQRLHRFTSGGVSLADAERLNEDEPLKALPGVEKLPDQTALGEGLCDIGQPGWQGLRRIARALVARALAQAEPKSYQHWGRTECFFDDTPIEVSGPSFEGATINYQGNRALSWQVLRVGPFLADPLLGASSPTRESPARGAAGRELSRRLPELRAANAPLGRKPESYWYADSASSAGKYLEEIAQHFGAWSVSDNRGTGPLEARAAELPESAWSTAQPTPWRDGTEHTAPYAGFRYQPGGCVRPQRFGVVRPRAAEELFGRYAFLATHEQDGPAQPAFEPHRLKGEKERRLSELLSDLDLHPPPCQDLQANRSFDTLAGLAWNLMQALQRLHLPAEEAPKRLRTLIRHLLWVPVERKRHARAREGVPGCAGGLGGVVAGVFGGVAAALSGVERGGRGAQRLKAGAGERRAELGPWAWPTVAVGVCLGGVERHQKTRVRGRRGAG